MEIAKLHDTTIKIKGKNASVVIDPVVKCDAEIIIATQPLESLSQDKVTGTRLIISGPGEYEVGGVSIAGKDAKNGVMYQIHEQSKILFVTSQDIASVPDDEEYDCLIVKVVSEFKDDALGPINAKSVILYGDVALATIKSEHQEKATKINIKKTADISGKTFIF